MGARFLDRMQLASGVVPINLAGQANDGDWVSLKHFAHALVAFYKGAGTAGQDPTLTLEQAKDVSGTGAKGLNFTSIFKKQGADLETIGKFTEVTQTAKSTYTDAASAEVEAIWAVELDAEDLDVSNGFDCVRARIADTGTSSQIGSILYLLGDSAYRPPPSALAD